MCSNPASQKNNRLSTPPKFLMTDRCSRIFGTQKLRKIDSESSAYITGKIGVKALLPIAKNQLIRLDQHVYQLTAVRTTRLFLNV